MKRRTLLQGLALLPAVRGKLGASPAVNTRLIRAAAAEYLAQWQPQTELESQRKILIGLGLNKMHKVVERQDTPEVRGAIAKIPHLVQVID